MSELARVEIDHRGELCIARIVGEVDISNARDLLGEIERAVPNGVATVAIDLTPTTYIDSAGVQLILLLADRLQTRRRRLRVVVPETAPIRAVLELTGISSVAPLEGSLEQEG